MTALPLVILMKATVLLLAAGALDALLRRRGSAAARHFVWTMAIIGVLALPIASVSLPEWTLRIPVARPIAAAIPQGAAVATVGTDAALDAGHTGLSGPDPESIVVTDTPGASSDSAKQTLLLSIVALYVVGMLLLLARLAIEPMTLRRVTRVSRPLTEPRWTEALDAACGELRLTRRVQLLQSPREIMPLTFGTRAPSIVLPASADTWTDDRRRAVLLHELAHVARRDCLVQRLAAFACAVYWPHPGVWWAARRLRAERELACDDRVLAAGAGAREYAGHLLELAHSLGSAPAPATALGMARPKQLESRLLAVLDAARNRAAIRPSARTAAVAIATVVLIPLAALHAAVVATDAPDKAAVTKTDGRSQDTAPALQDLIGTWELRLSRDPGMAQVTVRTQHGTHGRSVPLDQLPGLSVSQISAPSATIRLPIRREAGTFDVDGTCRNGVCGGTFVFEPSQSFSAALVKRGFEHPTPQQQMDLALADVGLDYLDALTKAGYSKPTLADVVRAAQHGVGAQYLREMTALGYRVGTLDALTRLRDHGVDPEYVKGMRDLGYRIDSPDDLTRLRDHGIDPSYVRGMEASGFSRLTVAELLTARDHGVDPQYVKGMRDSGYRLDDISSLVRTRDHGIDPEYVRGLASLGYRNLTLDGLLQARNHGVDPSYIREMAELGYKDQSLDALIKMRDHGVDPRYVKEIAELGYKSLPLDEVIRLRDHGVDASYIRRVQQKGLGHLSVDELIYRRDRGMDDPDAAARAVASQAQQLWRQIVTWLRS